MASLKFSLILFGLALLLRIQAWRYPAFRERLKERDVLAQLKTRDGRQGRWYRITNGRISSGAGVRNDADVALVFKTAGLAADLLMPPVNQLDQINALKDFNLAMEGDEDAAAWWTQTMMLTQTAGWAYGIDHGQGCHPLHLHDQRRAGLRL